MTFIRSISICYFIVFWVNKTRFVKVKNVFTTTMFNEIMDNLLLLCTIGLLLQITQL